jgi:hypothetical protein
LERIDREQQRQPVRRASAPATPAFLRAKRRASERENKTVEAQAVQAEVKDKVEATQVEMKETSQNEEMRTEETRQTMQDEPAKEQEAESSTASLVDSLLHDCPLQFRTGDDVKEPSACEWCGQKGEAGRDGRGEWACVIHNYHVCTNCKPVMQPSMERPLAGERSTVFQRHGKWWCQQGEVILELKTFQDGGEFDCLKCNRRQEMGKCGGGWYHEVYSVCLDCDSLPHAAVAWLGRSQARAVEAARVMSGGPDVTPPPGPKKIRRATPAKDGGDGPAEESRGEKAG